MTLANYIGAPTSANLPVVNIAQLTTRFGQISYYDEIEQQIWTNESHIKGKDVFVLANDMAEHSIRLLTHFLVSVEAKSMNFVVNKAKFEKFRLRCFAKEMDRTNSPRQKKINWVMSKVMNYQVEKN